MKQTLTWVFQAPVSAYTTTWDDLRSVPSRLYLRRPGGPGAARARFFVPSLHLVDRKEVTVQVLSKPPRCSYQPWGPFQHRHPSYFRQSALQCYPPISTSTSTWFGATSVCQGPKPIDSTAHPGLGRRRAVSPPHDGRDGAAPWAVAPPAYDPSPKPSSYKRWSGRRRVYVRWREAASGQRRAEGQQGRSVVFPREGRVWSVLATFWASTWSLGIGKRDF